MREETLKVSKEISFKDKIKETLLVQKIDTVGYSTSQYGYCGLTYFWDGFAKVVLYLK